MDTFAQYYETQYHWKVLKDKRTGAEMVAEYGSYNFVPKKTRGTLSIVPAYWNKWPPWTSFWFYHRVCSNEMVVQAIANDWPQPSALVSVMTPMVGIHLAEFDVTGDVNISAADAFSLTSRWQTSRDLVKEWLALDKPPLSSHTRFDTFKERDDYFGPMLNVARPPMFLNDFDFVNYIDERAEVVIGSYSEKEHKEDSVPCWGKASKPCVCRNECWLF